MVDFDIDDLSDSMLSEDKIIEIKEIIRGIKNKNKKDYLLRLSGILGDKPKRPLYYIDIEITQLPKYGTRNIIRYCGDYIDQLVRFTLEDNRYLSRWFHSPLGPNINKLKPYIDTNLYNNLVIFNKIYTRSKHDFNHKEDRSLFTYEDAVYMIFITKELSAEFINMSESAKDYNNEGSTAYRYNPKE
jgi:hypothetical protein